MLEMVGAGPMSEATRCGGGDRTGDVGLPMGEVTVSSGDKGGEGDSRGSSCSSGDAIVTCPTSSKDSGDDAR